MASETKAAGPLPTRAAGWLREHEAVAVVLASLALGALFSAPVWRPGPISLQGDWDYTLLWQRLGLQSLLRFAELPLWSPYTCGGMPLLANPQSRLLTPAFVLHLALGAEVGMRAELWLHVAAAFGGAYYLARTLGLGRTASSIAAGAFPTCSWHFAHFAVGHAATALPMAYLPWPLALCLQAVERRRYSWAMAAGAVIAVMFGEGGAYATAYAWLTLGMVLGGFALTRREFAPLGVLALAGVASFGFGALKFLPTIELMRTNARHTLHADGFFPLLMLRAVFSRNQDLLQRHPYQLWGWYEYGAYVSPVFVALAVLALVLDWRRSRLFSACFVAALALAVGYLFTIWEPHPRPLESPWTLLHRIPPFDSLRVPSRLLVVAVFFGGILSGFGAEAVLRRFGARARLPLFALLGLAVTDAWLVGTPNLVYVFRAPPAAEPPPARPPGPFAQFLDRSSSLMLDEGGASRRMNAIVAQDRGVLNCYEPIRPRRAALAPDEPGYRGEYYLLGAGKARLAGWTPLVQRYELDVPAPTTLVVNQNWFDDFRVVSGRGRAVSSGGLLGVELPAGKQTLALAYRCDAFWAGVCVSVATCLAAGALLWRERRNRHG